MTTAALTARAHDGAMADDDPRRGRRGAGSASRTSSRSSRSTSSLTDPGAKGALLRREGLYSSHIVEWRRAREVGALAGLEPKPRRSKRRREQAEIERLRRRNERLEDQLAKHRQALEIQGKASELLSQAAGRGAPGRRPSSPAGTSSDRVVLLGDRAAARHEGRVRGRRPVPGHPLPAGRPGQGDSPHAARPAPANKLTEAEASRCSPCCARPVLSTPRRPRCTSPSSTRASTWPRSRASTGSCGPTARCASAAGQATHPAEEEARARGRKAPERRVGAGTSPSSRDRQRGEYYDCYVVLDIFSRYVVAWCVAAASPASSPRSSSPTPSPATGAARPAHHPRRPRQLDDVEPGRRAATPSSASRRSHSRPHVSQRQPLLRGAVQDPQVLPGVPRALRLASQDARAFCATFFNYYNHEHRHSGIGYHTPASVHYGTADRGARPAGRDPRRRLRRQPGPVPPPSPEPPKLPTIAWINEPVTREETCTEGVIRKCLKSLDRFRFRPTIARFCWHVAHNQRTPAQHSHVAILTALASGPEPPVPPR